MDLNKLVRQAQAMQAKVQAAQQKLAEHSITGQSGGGLVTIEMNGRHGINRVVLDPSLLTEDKQVIEDLIAAAVNDAVHKVDKYIKDEMAQLSGGLDLPADLDIFKEGSDD